MLAIVLTSYAAWSGYYIFRTSVPVEGARVFVLWDDAMVSMQYGSNLREGHGSVWMQDGERVQGFVNHANVTLHADNLRGDNAHHQAETLFKAFGRALKMALAPDPRMVGQIPSTKGSL